MKEEYEELEPVGGALRVVLIFAAAFWLLSLMPSVLGAAVVLGRLEVQGLNRLEKSQVILASGLHLGEPVTPEDVKSAAERLGKSGFFSNLRFRYETSGDRMTVEFEVTEAAPFRRCVFDNFVGIPEAELDAVLRRKLPMYSGELPIAGPAVDDARAALEAFLEERGITADVSCTDSLDMSTQEQALLFEVSSTVYTISALEFPGAERVSPDVLTQASEQLIGQRYSRTAAAGFFRLSLLPIYRERGYLQASFGAVTAEPAPGGRSGGVLLRVPVTEGIQFHWAGADWQGNSLYSGDELDELMDMDDGEIANGVKIDRGLERIRAAYGRKGHIELQTRSQATFFRDEARVAYSFDLTEGATYHMGRLSLQGWPAEDERMLKESWELEPGQIYDSSYLDTFLDEMKKLTLHAPPGSTVGMTIQPDPVNLTVNVTIETK